MQESQEAWVRSLCWEDSLEQETATHSSILARIIPWREEPGRLPFKGSQRVGHDWATKHMCVVMSSLTSQAIKRGAVRQTEMNNLASEEEYLCKPFISYFFKFYFIFKLYNIVLVLPYIKMNPPQVYTCSPSWTLLPPPSPYHPSGSSQCTSPKHLVSCIESGLATRFIYDIIHISMPFSQIIPPSPSPTESKRLFYTSVSLLLSRIQGYCYHFSKFHIYALVYCIGVFLSGLFHSV